MSANGPERRDVSFVNPVCDCLRRNTAMLAGLVYCQDFHETPGSNGLTDLTIIELVTIISVFDVLSRKNARVARQTKISM